MSFYSIYLPPEGKYKPTAVKGASTFGYPWQYNPLMHKVTSDPCFCQSHNVFRRYADNKVVYTRTTDQVARGRYTYYLYNQRNHILETGEVALPVHITDHNWYMYKYKSNADQNAFIRSLSGRTSVMVASYQPARAAADGTSLDYYPLAAISCYPYVDADTPVTITGEYDIQSSITRYSFIHHTNQNVEVSIAVCHPAAKEQVAIQELSVATVANTPEDIVGTIPAAPYNTTTYNPALHPGAIVLPPSCFRHSAFHSGTVVRNVVRFPVATHGYSATLFTVSAPPQPGHIPFYLPQHSQGITAVFPLSRLPATSIQPPPAAGIYTYPRPPSFGGAITAMAIHPP